MKPYKGLYYINSHGKKVHARTKMRPFDLLSPKAKTIFLMTAIGITQKQIAQHLGVSHSTISTMWLRIRQRLNLACHADATCLALKEKLITGTISVQFQATVAASETPGQSLPTDTLPQPHVAQRPRLASVSDLPQKR
jgi:DNA-binding CsgD family transcriptional regulator